MNNTEIKEEQILYMDLYEKLKSMKFSGMAEELRIQLENPNSDLESFQNRFEKLVTAEWNLRYNKKFERYLKKANSLGIENILVSLGKDGAVLSNAQGIYKLN